MDTDEKSRILIHKSGVRIREIRTKISRIRNTGYSDRFILKTNTKEELK